MDLKWVGIKISTLNLYLDPFVYKEFKTMAKWFAYIPSFNNVQAIL